MFLLLPTTTSCGKGFQCGSTFKEGVSLSAQEEAALPEAQFATSSLRLVNSNILFMSLLPQLLSNVQCQIECMSDADSVPSRFDNVKADLDLMSKAIVDMDGGNGDLLKVVSMQYTAAHHHCADAWIDASELPNQTKKELKVAPQPVPAEDGSVTPLCLGYKNMFRHRSLLPVPVSLIGVVSRRKSHKIVTVEVHGVTGQTPIG